MSEGTCKACVFWDAHAWGTHGFCRSRPPVVNPMNGGTMWPETTDEEWCGEWDDGKDEVEVVFIPEEAA